MSVHQLFILVGIGVVGWSFSHYWLHRLQHWAMHYWPSLGRAESLHHLFDSRPRSRPNRRGNLTGFRWSLEGILLFCLLLCYVTSIGWAAGLAIGMTLGSAFDWWVHSVCHGPISNKKLPLFFQQRHRQHHHSDQTNISLATGLIWDVVFRSNRMPSS